MDLLFTERHWAIFSEMASVILARRCTSSLGLVITLRPHYNSPYNSVKKRFQIICLPIKILYNLASVLRLHTIRIVPKASRSFDILCWTCKNVKRFTTIISRGHFVICWSQHVSVISHICTRAKYRASCYIVYREKKCIWHAIILRWINKKTHFTGPSVKTLLSQVLNSQASILAANVWIFFILDYCFSLNRLLFRDTKLRALDLTQQEEPETTKEVLNK